MGYGHVYITPMTRCCVPKPRPGSEKEHSKLEECLPRASKNPDRETLVLNLIIWRMFPEP